MSKGLAAVHIYYHSAYTPTCHPATSVHRVNKHNNNYSTSNLGQHGSKQYNNLAKVLGKTDTVPQLSLGTLFSHCVSFWARYNLDFDI